MKAVAVGAVNTRAMLIPMYRKGTPKRPFPRRRVLGRLGPWNAPTGWELRLKVELLTLLGLDGIQA